MWRNNIETLRTEQGFLHSENVGYDGNRLGISIPTEKGDLSERIRRVIWQESVILFDGGGTIKMQENSELNRKEEM